MENLIAYIQMTKNKTQKGFTLIEILVVIGIIGVLTGLVTVNLQDARSRARDTQRKADLKAIQEALELYKNDQPRQSYPTDDTWKEDLTSKGYIKKLPVDPQAATGSWPDYSYTRTSGDTLSYRLTTCLENDADAGKDTTNTCTEGASYTLTEP